jgi:hypothetical protein
MACALLAVLTFNQEREGLRPKPRLTAVFSPENGGVAAVADSQTAQNHWASVTFDWTNRSDFKSSMRFQPTTNFSN